MQVHPLEQAVKTLHVPEQLSLSAVFMGLIILLASKVDIRYWILARVKAGAPAAKSTIATINTKLLFLALISIKSLRTF
jgi:hypothetical protein